MYASANDTSGSAASVASAQACQVELQSWQQRRLKFAEIVKNIQAGNPSAPQEFNSVLTQFDARPLSRTPIENMEILGLFYVPKDGIEAAFPVIVLNTVLGWYDALRFASESGRAEILSNEGFFNKAFVLGGPDMVAKAAKFLENNSERVAELLTQGFSFAERFRDTTDYDHQWPTAYGLERMIFAQGGSYIAPSPMPKEQWASAWEKAKQQVATYYQSDKSIAANFLV
jgi:hypothetical protein